MNKIASIQVLRAIASIMVLIRHSQSQLSGYEIKYGLEPSFLNSIDPRQLGAAGVDIFFVISGLVMALVTYTPRRGFAEILPFLRKRVVRIIPPYWLWTGILIALLLLLPSAFTSRSFSLRDAFFSLLLIPYTPTPGNTAPLMGLAWTLWYEMYFYLLVAAGLLVPEKIYPWALGGFIFLCTVVLPSPAGPVCELVTNPILWEFFSGFVIGVIFSQGAILSRTPCVIMIGLSVILFILSNVCALPFVRWLSWGVPSVLFVAGLLFFDRASKNLNFPAWLVALGDSSYSLYLSHLLVLAVIGKLFVIIGIDKVVPSDIFIFLCVIGCIAVNEIVFRVTERPLLRLLRNQKSSERTTAICGNATKV